MNKHIDWTRPAPRAVDHWALFLIGALVIATFVWTAFEWRIV